MNEEQIITDAIENILIAFELELFANEHLLTNERIALIQQFIHTSCQLNEDHLLNKRMKLSIDYKQRIKEISQQFIK